MSDHHIPHSVLAVRGAQHSIIGTCTIIASGFVLTALHVIDPEPVRELRLGDGIRVTAAATLPLRRYGPHRHLAKISYDRDRILAGSDLGTVDLALLAVPGLVLPPLALRYTGVRDGERIEVPGYPGGLPAIAKGPVTAHDGANFIADVTLGTGNSGSPAIDRAGRVVGLAVLDHDDAGAIFVGPHLITMFVQRTIPLLTHSFSHSRC